VRQSPAASNGAGDNSQLKKLNDELKNKLHQMEESMESLEKVKFMPLTVTLFKLIFRKETFTLKSCEISN